MTYEATSGDGPLCPYVIHPRIPDEPHGEMHRRIVAIQDEVYDLYSDRRDENGEFRSPDDEAQYEAEIMGRLNERLGLQGQRSNDFDYMRLFSATASPMSLLAGRTYVKAWWFQCQGCGFVLPAARYDY